MPAVARRELWLVALLVAAVLIVPLVIPPFSILVTKPLWLDELHTWLLARERPGPELVARLRGGADFNPPLLFVVDHLLLSLIPGLPAQVVLRLTSVLAVGAACTMLYRLHRSRFDVLPALAGALAPLAHTVVVSQLHEARFYAPWLLLIVALGWALQTVVEHPRSPGRFAALVALSAATCLIHYFGVISIGLVGVGTVAALRDRRSLRPLAGLALGTLALAAGIPVYLVQKQVLSVATWIPPATVSSAIDFLRVFLTYPAYVLVVIAALGVALIHRLTRFAALRPPARVRAATPPVAQGAFLALLALPVVLLAFSVVVQPALIARYALPTAIGGACVVALATARLPRMIAVPVVLGILAMHGLHMWRFAGKARAFSDGVTRGVAAANLVASDPRPVVSVDRFSLYPTALSAANRNARLRYVVIPPEAFRAYPGPMRNERPDFNIVERDAAVAHSAVFGFPVTMTLEELRTLPSYFMLLPDSAVAPPFPLLFADRAACRMHERLLLLSRRASASPAPVGVEIPACGPLPPRGDYSIAASAAVRSSTASRLTPRR